MIDCILLFFNTVLVNNAVLINFLGLCPFISFSKNMKTAISIGLEITFVMILISVCTWMIDTWILIPLELTYLRNLAYILIISVIVQFTEILIRKINSIFYYVFKIFIPPTTTNCAIFSVALFNINSAHYFYQSIVYSFSAAIGFSIIVILFAAIRERLELADIPAPFRGNAIILITIGLMSLAFMGFHGLTELS